MQYLDLDQNLKNQNFLDYDNYGNDELGNLPVFGDEKFFGRDEETILNVVSNINDLLDNYDYIFEPFDEGDFKELDVKKINSENIMDIFPEFSNKEQFLKLANGTDEEQKLFQKTIYESAIHYKISVQSIQWFLLKDFYLEDKNNLFAEVSPVNPGQTDFDVRLLKRSNDSGNRSGNVIKNYEASGNVEVDENIKRNSGFIFDLSGSMSKTDIIAVKNSVSNLKNYGFIGTEENIRIINGVKTVNDSSYAQSLASQNKIISQTYNYEAFLEKVNSMEKGVGSTPLEASILDAYQSGVNDLVVVTDGGSDPEANSNGGPELGHDMNVNAIVDILKSTDKSLTLVLTGVDDFHKPIIKNFIDSVRSEIGEENLYKFVVIGEDELSNGSIVDKSEVIAERLESLKTEFVPDVSLVVKTNQVDAPNIEIQYSEYESLPENDNRENFNLNEYKLYLDKDGNIKIDSLKEVLIAYGKKVGDQKLSQGDFSDFDMSKISVDLFGQVARGYESYQEQIPEISRRPVIPMFDFSASMSGAIPDLEMTLKDWQAKGVLSQGFYFSDKDNKNDANEIHGDMKIGDIKNQQEKEKGFTPLEKASVAFLSEMFDMSSLDEESFYENAVDRRLLYDRMYSAKNDVIEDAFVDETKVIIDFLFDMAKEYSGNDLEKYLLSFNQGQIFGDKDYFLDKTSFQKLLEYFAKNIKQTDGELMYKKDGISDKVYVYLSSIPILSFSSEPNLDYRRNYVSKMSINYTNNKDFLDYKGKNKVFKEKEYKDDILTKIIQTLLFFDNPSLKVKDGLDNKAMFMITDLGSNDGDSYQILALLEEKSDQIISKMKEFGVSFNMVCFDEEKIAPNVYQKLADETGGTIFYGKKSDYKTGLESVFMRDKLSIDEKTTNEIYGLKLSVPKKNGSILNLSVPVSKQDIKN